MIRTLYSFIAVVAPLTLGTAAPQTDANIPSADTPNVVADDDINADNSLESIDQSEETADTETTSLPDLSSEEIEKRVTVLAERQDELSAIIQDLTWKWANKEIVTFLEDVDYALLDARDALDDRELGGETIAAQNDAIEKIYQAAKKNQQNCQSQSDSLGAMMDQLDYMTGKKSTKPGKGQPGKEGKDGDQAGNGGGNGAEDDGIANGGETEKAMLESRTIPKTAGRTPSSIPSEFRDGMEALRESLANESK